MTWMAIALGALVVIGLLYVYATRDGGADQDKLGDDEVATASARSPDKRCSSPRTYDAIKRELFRRAAVTRGTARTAFDQISAYSALRVEAPLLKGTDADLGTVRCSANVALDLPPGTQVVGGRRTLAASIDYSVQPATDGSGDVVMIDNADSIVVPLATLARTGQGSAPIAPPPGAILPQAEPVGEPAPADGPFPAPPVAPPPPPRAPEAAPAPPPPRAAASPSFNCRFARTRGEIAVCGDSGLAALDRQMASQYVRAVGAASPQQAALLRRTRGEFLRHRDACPSDACISQTYRGRMREIADIMSGRWQPGG
ncbi:lysozyme inhibitor LprI family protein [Sphingomonas mesophila]|uniref:lysozyme inhibitor LprI family protein n=1 Tax=Sphingomonas mesophila TaxID=2303576 RepID=UPI0013C32980|nr:hypothetical protein [Sphingomonas mesophila]